MHKILYALLIAGVIFLIGKWIYDNYGTQIQQFLGLQKINPNAVQASSASKTAVSQ